MKNEFYGIDFDEKPFSVSAMTAPIMATERIPMVLAMAYVPIQQLQTVYEPEQAFEQGTLFPELDKPFLAGSMACG